jgi:hypothetical protein
MPFKYDSLAERLIANSVISQDSFYDGEACWIWVGAVTVNRNGQSYGKLDVRIKRGPRKGQRKTWLAHRLALVVFKHRVMTRRMVGKHLCNNTLCINPAHLVGGTQRSNVRQCVREGRHYTPWREAA